MSLSVLGEALLSYVLFLPLLTFHEWAHAWSAWKLGDDTAHSRGRVSLNPLVHMEMLGTVILPLVSVVSGAMGAGVSILGWGKPVPVNPNNLSNPRLHDSLIAMAGPAINLLLAVVLIGLMKVGFMTNQQWIVEVSARMAFISLVLCFFNLLPVPPLDGSHLWMNAVNMSAETYQKLAQFGFIAVFVLIQFQAVRSFLSAVVNTAFIFIARIFGLE
jgi:Zn-dependent protease